MRSRMKDTLLLVGNADSDRSNLYTIFESHYCLLEAEDVPQAAMLLDQNANYIAAVIADLPPSDGSDLRSLVEAAKPASGHGIPVVALVTPVGTGQREETAFMMGVADVVHKPYTNLIIRRRLEILTELYTHQWQLEKLVEEQSHAIRKNNQTMVDTLSSIIEYRSTESGNHVLRLRRFTQLLLQEVARCFPEYQLDEYVIDRISSAAALHDIGKISIPDSILNKPDKLDDEEFALMKTHTTIGAQLAEQIGDIGDPMYLRYIYNICLSHHERWDGRGYPQGLKGDEIPICAQVVGLADAYDALTTARVYKPPFSHKAAVNMILNGECGAFSPKLLECFKRVRNLFAELSSQYSDGYSPKSDQIRLPLPAPVRKEHPLTALELSHLKYQTLLHHLGDTVIELDVSNHNYHVVYNPNPDFVALFQNADFEEMSVRLMADGVHPENIDNMAEMRANLRQLLFGENQRKHSFRCQIYSHLYQKNFPYEVTLLRVNTDVPGQRLVIAIFHNLRGESKEPHPAHLNNIPELSLFYGLSGGALCCRPDDDMTILRSSGTLFPLTGFSAQQIRDQFSDSFLAMVHPEDRSVLSTALAESKRSLSQWECSFRLLRNHKDPVWVLCKGKPALTPQGQDICPVVLTDITNLKQREYWLENRASLHQSLVDLSEGAIIEWDLKTDYLVCSDRWMQMFGYPLTSAEFTPGAASHLHPDDIPLMQHRMNHLMNSDRSGVVDLRIANSEGRYLWCRLRAKVIRNASGEPERITAILYDIDELKRDALAMRKQAERDGLTKLLNKASAQQQITEYLSGRAPNSNAALLVMDLDNFKSINDTLGHLYGDAVLTQIGSTLQNFFRSQDILGRIGGDEFMILMKDIPNRELVEDRCQLLVDTFREMLRKLMPKLQVSVSVGAALVPRHGTTYADLFHHADEALYAAKRAGKCQYHIYSPKDAYQTLNDEAALTRIDSDEQPALLGETLMRFVFHRLYESRDIDATIHELLAYIGTQFNVSRVYIFENNDDNTTCSNTFEWCNEGIEPEKDNLQNLSYLTDLAGWPDVYKDNGVLYCADINELEPRFRDIVEPQGIKSMLHCAILDRGVFRGYVGFDECTANYLWTQDQIAMLQFLAEVLAVFLIKQRATDKKA